MITKFRIILGLFLLSAGFACGQETPAEYSLFVRQADSLYRGKEYLASGMKYTQAFEAFGWKGFSEDRYNAACSWALAGKADSAFFQLRRLADKADFMDYKRVLADPDLQSLYADPRWESLLLKIRENKDKSEAAYDRPLLHLLDSMVAEDQKWRGYLVKHFNGELKDDTISYETISRKCSYTDSMNYFTLKNIFARYGYPNYDLIGTEGSHNFWLLVQHQDMHPAFQDSVLLRMKTEVDAGKAAGTDYAYLVDRVKVNTGQPQVYGTQMGLNEEKTSYIPQNVIEPEKLNERRKSVGLGSIESYIELMNTRYSGSLKKE